MLGDMQRLLERVEPDRSCHTCANLATRVGGVKHCGAWDSEVPAESQEAGCERWCDLNEVPF